MKSKITILKDVLKIVILIFVIFSAIKSCSRATNIDDIIEYVGKLEDKGLLDTGCQVNVSNWFNNLDANTKDYYNNHLYFIGISANDSNYLPNKLFYCVTEGINIGLNSSNRWVGKSASNSNKNISIKYSTLNWDVINSTSSSGFGLNEITSWRYMYTTLPINTPQMTLGANKEYGGNYLFASFTFTPIKDAVVTIDNIQGINAKKNVYQFADVTLGKVEEYLEENRYTLMELTLDNNIVAYIKYNNISKQIINSSYMGIEVADNSTPSFDLIRVNNWKLYLNQIYTLNIYNGDENVSNDTYNDKQTFNYIFLKNNAVISNGIITNYGSGDGFTNQDSTNAIIDNTNQNNGFWENAYNNLFVISGDYVENKLNEVKVNLGFSGDYEEEKAFINLITEQNGDFVISWNSYTPHFSVKGEQINNVQMISGDSINFSQLERENEALHEVMTWTRTLIGFSLGYLLIHNYWKTLMLTLGVGAQVYGSVEEESKIATQRQEEKARRNEENIRNAYERQRYRQWLFDHRKR